jgi:hypothetical protein
VPPNNDIAGRPPHSIHPYRACLLTTTNDAVVANIAVDAWMVLKSACTAHLHMIYAFVPPNTDARGRPPQSIYTYRACLLITTNRVVVANVAVDAWMMLKSACTAHLHMIYAFVPPSNDIAGRPPQSIYPHRACLLTTTNGVVVANIAADAWMVLKSACTAHLHMIYAFVPPNTDAPGRPPQSIYKYRGCLLITTNRVVVAKVAVDGWMVFKSACTAHLHMIYAFVPPNNDIAGRPPQSIYPHRACLLITINGAVVANVAVDAWMVLKSACTAHLHMIYAFVPPNTDAPGRPPQSIYKYRGCLLITTNRVVVANDAVDGWMMFKSACFGYLHMIYAFVPPNNDTAGRPPHSIYPYRACLLITTNRVVVAKVAVDGWMVFKSACTAHLHMIYAFVPPNTDAPGGPPQSIYPYRACLLITTNGVVVANVAVDAWMMFKSACFGYLHMIYAFVPPNNDTAGRPPHSIYPYRACLLITTNRVVVAKVAVDGWMVFKSACTAHLHMIYAFVPPNNDIAGRPPHSIYPYRTCLLITTNSAVLPPSAAMFATTTPFVVVSRHALCGYMDWGGLPAISLLGGTKA